MKWGIGRSRSPSPHLSLEASRLEQTGLNTSVMELLPSRKAFLVEAGTKVAVRGGLVPSSNARMVHILEGKHGSEKG